MLTSLALFPLVCSHKTQIFGGVTVSPLLFGNNGRTFGTIFGNDAKVWGINTSTAES